MSFWQTCISGYEWCVLPIATEAILLQKNVCTALYFSMTWMVTTAPKTRSTVQCQKCFLNLPSFYCRYVQYFDLGSCLLFMSSAWFCTDFPGKKKQGEDAKADFRDEEKCFVCVIFCICFMEFFFGESLSKISLEANPCWIYNTRPFTLMPALWDPILASTLEIMSSQNDVSKSIADLFPRLTDVSFMELAFLNCSRPWSTTRHAVVMPSLL